MVAATDPAEPRERRPSAFALGVSALFALFLLLAAGAVVQGRINHDEGWYLYAAGRVLEGALPYRDFAYFQAPLLPFVHAPAQLLFGPGVVVGRLTSLALSIGTVALGARLAFVHGGRLAALFFLGILCLTPQQLWAFTTTRTEPLVAFWLMLAAFFLLARPVSARASGAALAAMVLGYTTTNFLDLLLNSLDLLILFCWFQLPRTDTINLVNKFTNLCLHIYWYFFRMHITSSQN